MLQQRKRVPERRCFIFFVRFFVFCNTFEQGCKSGLPLLYMWRFSGAPSDAGRWQAAEQHMLRDLLPSSREPLDKSPAGGEVYDGLSDTPMYNERIDQSRPRFGICTRIGLSESHPGPMTAEVDSHFLSLWALRLRIVWGIVIYRQMMACKTPEVFFFFPPSTGENIPHVSLIFLLWRFCSTNPSGSSSQPSRLQHPARKPEIQFHRYYIQYRFAF